MEDVMILTKLLLGFCFIFTFSLSYAADSLKHFHPKGKPPSEHTLKKYNEQKKQLPFSDKKDFEEQKKGFIAAPDFKKIKNAAGQVIWDMARYNFLLNDDLDISLTVESNSSSIESG